MVCISATPGAAWLRLARTFCKPKARHLMNENLKKQVAQALGQIPSGCFVMTAAHGGKATGILASWVQQASFDPPMVTVAVKHGRPIQELLESSGHFVL